MGSFTRTWFVAALGSISAHCVIWHIFNAAVKPHLFRIEDILRLLKRRLGEVDRPVCPQSRRGPSLWMHGTLYNTRCQCTGKFHLKAAAISDLHQVAKVFYLLHSLDFDLKHNDHNCFESLELPVQSKKKQLYLKVKNLKWAKTEVNWLEGWNQNK